MITLQFNKLVLVFFVLCLSLTNTSTASELTHKFGNPSFSKEGYSQHALSIEQLQYTSETVSSLSVRASLNFNHPIKELIWVFRRNDATQQAVDGRDITTHNLNNFTSSANPTEAAPPTRVLAQPERDIIIRNRKK